MTTINARTPLPLREWLELGQVMTDKTWLRPKYFRKHMTHEIQLGENIKLQADGKTYRGPARFYLDDH